MLIDSEVDRYLDRAPAILAENVEAFFRGNAIERNALESFALRSFEGDFDCFYVSTVARGLAGSKSDVDLIVVSSAAAMASSPLSSMLFHANRRLGLKLVNQRDLGGDLAVLDEVSARIAGGQFIVAEDQRKRLAIGWQELERLINGVSFSAGARYLRYLPQLSRWTLIHKLQEFERQAGFFRLASLSGNPAAASAYAFGAVVCAMDAVMASCGQVQSNTKWTLQRWHRFAPAVRTGKAREAAARVAKADSALRPLMGSPSADLSAALADLQSFLWREFVPTTQLGTVRYELSAGVHRHPFLPDADSICSEKAAAVIGAATLDRIRAVGCHDFSTSDGGAARDALRLLQLGMLSGNIVQAAA